MGSSYVWVCDDLKEYVDPYPLNESHVFIYLARGRWSGHSVRVLDDQNSYQQDEYYTVTSRDRAEAEACGYDPDHVYRDVTEHAKHYRRWLREECDCEPLNPDAAPDVAATAFSLTTNAPPTTKGPSTMSTSPTGETTATGSNPAGVASPNNAQDTASSDRTELRSVPTHENPRRPAPGDLVEFAINVLPSSPRDWRLARLHFVEELTPPKPGRWIVYGWFVPDEDKKPVGEQLCRGPGGWRWPETGVCRRCGADLGRQAVPVQHVAPGTCDPSLCLACCEEGAKGEVPSDYVGPDGEPCVNDGKRVPAEPFRLDDLPVRRCTALVMQGPNMKEPCPAVLGNLRCDVCKGQRCYHHCAGVDHFKGVKISRGGAGRIEWKVVEISSGRFVGQIYERVGDVLEILSTINSDSAEDVLEAIDDEARQLETARRPNLNDAADQLLKQSKGKVSNERRSRVLLEVIGWLREGEAEWLELVGPDVGMAAHDVVEKCKQLHDRLVLELFSRIGGAL